MADTKHAGGRPQLAKEHAETSAAPKQLAVSARSARDRLQGCRSHLQRVESEVRDVVNDPVRFKLHVASASGRGSSVRWKARTSRRARAGKSAGQESTDPLTHPERDESGLRIALARQGAERDPGCSLQVPNVPDIAPNERRRSRRKATAWLTPVFGPSRHRSAAASTSTRTLAGHASLNALPNTATMGSCLLPLCQQFRFGHSSWLNSKRRQRAQKRKTPVFTGAFRSLRGGATRAAYRDIIALSGC